MKLNTTTALMISLASICLGCDNPKQKAIAPEIVTATKAQVLGTWKADMTPIPMDPPATAFISRLTFKDDGFAVLEAVIMPTKGNFTTAAAEMTYTVTGKDALRLANDGTATITAAGIQIHLPAVPFRQYPKPLQVKESFKTKEEKAK